MVNYCVKEMWWENHDLHMITEEDNHIIYVNAYMISHNLKEDVENGVKLQLHEGVGYFRADRQKDT
jgi:hypothetical protein